MILRGSAPSTSVSTSGKGRGASPRPSNRTHTRQCSRRGDSLVVAARRGRPRQSQVGEVHQSDEDDDGWLAAFGKPDPQNTQQATTAPAREPVYYDPAPTERGLSAGSKWGGTALGGPVEGGDKGYDWDDDIEDFAEEAEEGDISGLEELRRGALAAAAEGDLVLSPELAEELEPARVDIGDADVEGFVPPNAWVDIYTKPRYDLSLGAPPPGDNECDDMMVTPENIGRVPPEKYDELRLRLAASKSWADMWKFEGYMEQMFEVQSRHWVSKNKYAQVLRIANIMSEMRTQDEFVPADVDLSLMPNITRAYLVFDREFKWFDQTYDVEGNSRVTLDKLMEQDMIRYRNEFAVTKEFAQRNVKAAVDPLAGLIGDVLPGASLNVMEQQQFLDDVLPSDAELADRLEDVVAE